MEIVGMLAPIASVVMLIWYRRRAPRAALIGILGAICAASASAVGFIGARAAYFGGGGMEGIAGRLEHWSIPRFILLLLGIALLTVAAFVGSAEGRRIRGRLAVSGVIAAAIGTVLHYVTIDINADHEFINILIPMIVEAAQFALLGAGVLVLSLAVIARRPTDDARADPLAQAQRAASWAWGAYRSTRTRR